MNDDLHPVQIARIRQMTLGQRLGRGIGFLRSARHFIAAGLRARHPEWSEDQAMAESAEIDAKWRRLSCRGLSPSH
jgi:hypothetical protein